MFFFSSRRRHTRLQGDWSSDVCSSDLAAKTTAKTATKTATKTARKPAAGTLQPSAALAAVIGEGTVARTEVVKKLWERSEEHTSELQSPCNLVCRLLLEKKNHPTRLPRAFASSSRKSGPTHSPIAQCALHPSRGLRTQPTIWVAGPPVGLHTGCLVRCGA